MSIGIDLKRFDNFKDADFRSLEVLSPLEIKAQFAVQDAARAFDWITIELEFSGVSDARLVDGNKIAYIDMSEGVTIIEDNDSIAFGIGNCSTIDAIENSSCYIIANELKSFEARF